MDNFRELADALKEEVIALRRQFHAHPELSWKETETQCAIMEYLTALGLSPRTAAKTGVVAVLRGGKSNGKRLGIRADIDALPVMECTGLPYASENAGVSHACGHDTHIAIALATAKAMVQIRESLPVDICFLFQPAEETPGNSGGDLLREDEDVKACDRMAALHIWSKIPAGKAGISEGAVMASTDTFEVTVTGKGGHGAVPEETIDPVVAAAEFVLSAQRLVSRMISPFSPAVLTIGSLHTGTTWNVIPETAKLMGTARAYDPKTAAAFPERIRQIAEGVGMATGTTFTVDYHKGPDPVINDPAATRCGKAAAKAVFGEDNLIEFRQMVGEDFAQYYAPKCLLFLGAGYHDESRVHPQHSPHYEIEEAVLPRGIEYFLRYAFNYGAETY